MLRLDISAFLGQEAMLRRTAERQAALGLDFHQLSRVAGNPHFPNGAQDRLAAFTVKREDRRQGLTRLMPPVRGSEWNLPFGGFN